MPVTLYGREHEQAVVDGLLADARRGASGVLVLRGEPGIGKTALLDHAADAATGHGMRLIRATGVEYEAELPFAALHLLLGADFGRLAAALPEPQRLALQAAFGITAAGDTPRSSDRLLTGLAVLTLLAELAEEQPLLCVVDDAQWLDHASAEALLLAARRLQAEPVALLFAAREGEGAFPAQGLPELRLEGLTQEASGRLLDARSAGSTAPAPAVRARLLAEAHGNPLALTELPRALAAETRADGGRAARTPAAASEPPGAVGPLGPAGAVPLTTRLQIAFHGQVSRLPAATQTLLLLAAAEENGDPEVLRRAAGHLGLAIDDLGPAEDAGLVRLVGRVAFRHPLLRAAVYQRAPLAQRLAAHRALADALDTAGSQGPGGADTENADRRAWHLAIAAPGPDERIARALEQAALRAHERGGHAEAAAAIERAARLTPDPATAARRWTLAAEAALESGDLAHAHTLAARAETRITAGGPDPGAPERAAGAGGTTQTEGPGGPGTGLAADGSAPALLRTLRHVQATARFLQGDFPAAYRLLLRDAARTAGADPQQAARMLLQAFHAAWYLGEEPLREVTGALAALDLPERDAIGPLARYVVAAVRPVLGEPSGALPGVDETVEAARLGGAMVPWDVVQVCGASLILGRDAETHRLAARLAADARARGGFGQLPTILFFLAEAELFHGRPRDALAGATEALRIARDTGQRQWTSQLTAFLAHLAAVEGDPEACRRLADEALAVTGPDAAGVIAPGTPWAQWALGLLDLGAGRAREALDRLEALANGPMRHHVCATRAIPDLVEAAVRLGCPERAAGPLAYFRRWAKLTGQPWAEALVLRCRALAEEADEDEVRAAYERALALYGGDAGPDRPFERARTALLYGEWLRRGRRRTRARGPLREAIGVFERLGAVPWAERARAELDATGESVPRAGAAGPAGLTPQESQIVRLAARGLSNRDIAAQLFLSPRTVGYHLYKAYPKLGVAARGELADLPELAELAGPAA
ncbi:LuxR family transcriptional regulator [Streptomyces sp. ICBB 8177]|uniref:helix-turn-helix transcriptional regulator n=1 Tax=Streptomyces sp. ICBB 8177 TaxID=563922 RepID=UPI000D67CDCF|nr:LuxR family transcriptional regulator [Streptomyces sp. ICBB 8177]PWI45844.1 helix-turn-helix transcriptional regulator [Streptomyces sp. ICBB 8177]